MPGRLGLVTSETQTNSYDSISFLFPSGPVIWSTSHIKGSRIFSLCYHHGCIRMRGNIDLKMEERKNFDSLISHIPCPVYKNPNSISRKALIHPFLLLSPRYTPTIQSPQDQNEVFFYFILFYDYRVCLQKRPPTYPNVTHTSLATLAV